jgi:hypothetical protein
MYVTACMFRHRVDVEMALLHVFAIGYEVSTVRRYCTRHLGRYRRNAQSRRRHPFPWPGPPMLRPVAAKGSSALFHLFEIVGLRSCLLIRNMISFQRNICSPPGPPTKSFLTSSIDRALTGGLEQGSDLWTSIRHLVRRSKPSIVSESPKFQMLDDLPSRSQPERPYEINSRHNLHQCNSDFSEFLNCDL